MLTLPDQQRVLAPRAQGPRVPRPRGPLLQAKRTRESEQERTFLPEVQALRALAVSLVVLYHFWPAHLPGGFVGVDVFFVISGFLITSHLHREVGKHGRIRLCAFYARRARRLLPASLLVLVVTAVASYLFLPITRWTTVATDIVASTFYVQNWSLADRAVDYSALGQAPSAVQHFWSLSVEEQFYLGWPALILLLLALGRRFPGVRRDHLLLGGMLAVTGASLAYSVYATATDPAAAYFVTPTRIWELGAGAALALWTRARVDRWTRLRPPRPGRGTALRWAGLAAILGSAVAFSHATAFPGYIALVPVLGTVAVIAAAGSGPRDPLLAIANQRPVQFLGDVSYALYLWHWPVLVIAPAVLAGPLFARHKLVLLVLCLALAWGTQRLVERPTQSWRILARPASTAACAVAAMLAVTALAGLQWYEVKREEGTALALLAAAEDDQCFGAAALPLGATGCTDVYRAPASTARLPEDAPWFGEQACEREQLELTVDRCRFGDSAPARKVALVGDSHAEHWRGAVHRIARVMNWEVVEMFHGGCPVTAARVLHWRGDDAETEDCHRWGQQVGVQLAVEEPDYILASGWALALGFDEDPARSLELGSQGFVDAWSSWVASTDARVYVIRDIPNTGDVDVPGCLASNPGDPLACSRPRAEAVVPDAMTVAAERIDSDRVQLVDLSDYFCDDTTCYGAVGGAVVYYDADHMSAQFSRSLAPMLLDRIDAERS